MSSIINLTPKQLRQAADVQEKIQELQDELNQLLGGTARVPTAAPEAPRKRKVSVAARAKMAAAQRERWARIKGTTASTVPEAPKKKQVNEARLAALAKAREARWAKHKAAKKGTKAASDGKPKIQRSAAWRAAISAAAKARWAKARAAGKSTL